MDSRVKVDGRSSSRRIPAPQPSAAPESIEHARLAKGFPAGEGWKKWGPYLSERQWGTVREDYSPHGNAWEYFPHDHARARAYRWGEDGLGGFSDLQQRICLSVALWNGRDPILKERLFGLTNGEGNHGEDVKELYYYLDATPTHSYLKMLYKYPQAEFPYARLLDESRRRGIGQPEFELVDSGVLSDDRYFDVFVEYAQAAPDDILMRVTVHNRGPEVAPLQVLPQLWFRNTWSWKPGAARPSLRMAQHLAIQADHPELGTYYFASGSSPTTSLFTDNESNARRLWGDTSHTGYWKDAFHACVVEGDASSVNPAKQGTKAALWHVLNVPAHGKVELRLRLTKDAIPAFADFDTVLAKRIREADQFYSVVQRGMDSADARSVQRQAYAGMIWSKQFFYLDVPQWLMGDPGQPSPPAGRARNREWAHLNNADIISMPDKWEYPWYAAWDLAFHCIPLAHLDPEFAKEQLLLLTREWYMHPNGQMPAYEWAFGDVNPPVHAWATWRVFQIDRKHSGSEKGDLAFLERVFHKLMLNFTWWVNRKDAEGRNVFQGGFLGLDNIGVFDRSSQLPTGGHIDQADGTSWMAMYALNLMRIALELAQHNHVYEDIATKFLEHFLHIAEAMAHIGGDGMGGGVGLWDDTDKFFYDVLHLPDGRMTPLKVRSMVGLIPLFAVETLEPELLEKVPDFNRRLQWFLAYRPDLASLVSHWNEEGRGKRRLLSLLRGHRMKRLITRKFHHYYGDEFRVECPTGSGHFVTLEEAASELACRLTRIFLADESGARPVFGHHPQLQSDPNFKDHLLFYEYFHGDTGRGVGASHQTGWTGLIAKLLMPRYSRKEP